MRVAAQCAKEGSAVVPTVKYSGAAKALVAEHSSTGLFQAFAVTILLFKSQICQTGAFFSSSLRNLG